MEVAHSRYIKKKKRITLNGVFYAIISSCSFGFSPLFSLALIAVGLVWIGVSSEKGTETFSAVFKSNRKRNIERFASTALNYLRVKIVNELK